MRNLFLVIQMLILVACNAPSNFIKTELIELSPSEIRSLESAVRDNLKDPSSAQFGRYIAFNIKNKNGTTTTGACGNVNAKNSYGGYVGMTPYSALGVNGTFVSASISKYMKAVCLERYGVVI